MRNVRALKNISVSIIIGLIIFLLLYRINCILVNIHISPLSPLVIIYFMYSIVTVLLIGCANLRSISFAQLLAGIFVGFLITHFIISIIFTGIFDPPASEEFALIFVYPACGLLFYILFYAQALFQKFVRVILRHDDFPKLRAKLLFYLFLALRCYVFGYGYNFTDADSFYPKYVAARTKTAIRTNNIKICQRLSTLFYTSDYDNQRYLDRIYDYTFVSSNTCLAAAKAINNADPKKCFIKKDDEYIQFAMDRSYSQIIRYENHGLDEFHRLLIARNCQILYKSHFPDSAVKIINVRGDVSPPVLVISQPPSEFVVGTGGCYREDTIIKCTVIGRTEPGAELNINNNRYQVEQDGSFAHTISLISEEIKITVSSTDETGNGTTQVLSRKIELNNEIPNIDSTEKKKF